MNFLRADTRLASRSYYAATASGETRQPPLTQPAAADVAIVGGGLAGLSAAIDLADRGFRVALLEAQEVGWGASGRNGGQAIHGLACDQATIEDQTGPIEARRIWDMTIEALDLIHARCRRFYIDCDWQAGFLNLATSERKGRQLQRWADGIESRYGYRLQRIAAPDIGSWIASSRFHSGVHDARSGHLHPLKYCHGLARAAMSLGVTIFEDTPVTRIEHGSTAVLHTPKGSMRASQVLLAGNVYLQGLAPQLQARVMPVGTYIACTERLAPAVADTLIPSRAAVCDTNFVLDYFRVTPDDRLLYGGRVSYSTLTPGNLAATMHRRMARTFPQLVDTRIEYAWGGFVDITMNRAPDFGRLDAQGASNVYYLQGFSGHGLALTGLAGRLVAEAMAGDATRFDTFARLRHRRFPGGRYLRTPTLVLGMAYHRLRDLL